MNAGERFAVEDYATQAEFNGPLIDSFSYLTEMGRNQWVLNVGKTHHTKLFEGQKPNLLDYIKANYKNQTERFCLKSLNP